MCMASTWCWSWSCNTLGPWWEESTHWKRPWCWERSGKAGGEADERGWDGWMTLPTQWTWVWSSSRRWWRRGKPGVLQSTESQRVRHHWVDNKYIYTHPVKKYWEYKYMKHSQLNVLQELFLMMSHLKWNHWNNHGIWWQSEPPDTECLSVISWPPQQRISDVCTTVLRLP